MPMPYEVKLVTGGTPGATEYDEENVLRHPTEREAINDACGLGRTSDVFERGTKIARVHVDGGVDDLR